MKNSDVMENLVEIRVKLDNHLKHHEVWFKYVIAPSACTTFVGIVLILVKLYLG